MPGDPPKITSKQHTFGLVATLITMGFVGIGLPSQIIRNFQNTQVEGSLMMWILQCATVGSWMVYGLILPRKDFYIITPNALGLLCILVILAQYLVY